MATQSKTYLDLAGLTTYDGKIKAWVGDQIDALDVTEFALAEKDSSTNVVTIHGISETDGQIAVGASSTNDVTLAAVAATGAAEDVSITDSGSYFTSSDVEGALAELAQASSGGVASKTIYVTDNSAGQSDYAKVYKIWQGANAPDAATDPAALIGTINIPLDKVLQDAEVVDITYNSTDGKLYDGATDVTALIVGPSGTASASDAGKYIKMVMQNVTDPLYVSVKELCDVYTAASGATQVQLAISSTNEISATLVAGGVGATELAANAVTTVKIVDDAVTADKVAIAAHTETQTASTDGLALSVTTTDGQVSAVSGSIAANTYEAYGAAAAAVAALDTVSDVDLASFTAGTSGSADVITLTGSMKEVDGIISAGTADTITLSTITDAQINALF